VLKALSFVSRATPKSNDRHVILGAASYDPRKFAEQMGLNLANGWGIVRTIVDMCRSMDEGKYVLVKDPNKTLLRLYKVPMSTFGEGEEDGEDLGPADGEDAE
jgi:translation initiation factor 3 subunit D